MEILHVSKLDDENYEENQAKCACAGYEGYCSLLVAPPPPIWVPPPMPRPFL
jgi:hypothetical protein